MKHLSIKSTVYPKDKIKVLKNIPLSISKSFWTNFYDDKYNEVVNSKKHT